MTAPIPTAAAAAAGNLAQASDAADGRGATGPARRAPAPLASSATTATGVADGARTAWESAAAALAPIIGPYAVSVLYRRCLAGARTDRTWLPAAGVADPPTADWAALHAALSRQTPVAAHEASAALSGAFRDLLGSLIGPALTQQLLHPAPALPTSGSSAQDTTP